MQRNTQLSRYKANNALQEESVTNSNFAAAVVSKKISKNAFKSEPTT